MERNEGTEVPFNWAGAAAAGGVLLERVPVHAGVLGAVGSGAHDGVRRAVVFHAAAGCARGRREEERGKCLHGGFGRRVYAA